MMQTTPKRLGRRYSSCNGARSTRWLLGQSLTATGAARREGQAQLIDALSCDDAVSLPAAQLLVVRLAAADFDGTVDLL